VDNSKIPLNTYSHEKLLSAETYISYLLRAGVVLSAILLGIGLIKETVFESKILGVSFLHRETFESFFKISEFLEGLSKLESRSVLYLGLITLIFLPFARVLLMGVLFLIQKDYIFVMLSLLVVGILLGGMIIGLTF